MRKILILPLMVLCFTSCAEKIGIPKSVYEWDKARFTQKEAAYWKLYNFAPQQAKKWHKADFSDPEIAHKWIKKGFAPEAAKEWRAAGFFDPAEAKYLASYFISINDAKKWKIAGFTPYDTRRGKEDNISLVTARLWRSSADISPGEINNWKEIGFIAPEKAMPWVEAGVSFWTVKEWSSVGLTPTETKRWQQYKFTALSAKLWSNQGFSPQEAEKWSVAGFSNKPKKARGWKEAGLSHKEVHQAEKLKLLPKDIKKWQNITDGKTINHKILVSIALCKANNLMPEKFIEQFKMLGKECGGEKDQSDMFLLSPYEIKGKCYFFEAKSFQILNKSVGLFRTTGEASPGETIFLDFGDGFAPIVDVIGAAKGVDPLEYKAVLGNKNVVHSFKVLWFLKIPPALKKKMTKLGL